MNKLPSMEYTFSIEIKGSNTGQLKTGKFTYKRPNIGMQSEISKTAAKLNGDLKNLDEDIKFLHHVLSTLRHTLIDSPDWWSDSLFGVELYDTNVILEIYRNTQDFEDEWYQKVWKEENKESKKVKK
jgi:hypothetical protein